MSYFSFAISSGINNHEADTPLPDAQIDFFKNSIPKNKSESYPAPGIGLAKNKKIHIKNLSNQDILSTQIKFTYHGPQNKPIKTFIIIGEFGNYNKAVFRIRNQLYGNDELPHNTRIFRVSAEKLRKLIRLISEVSETSINWQGTSISIYLKVDKVSYLNYHFIHSKLSDAIKLQMIAIIKNEDFTKATMGNYNPITPFFSH